MNHPGLKIAHVRYINVYYASFRINRPLFTSVDDVFNLYLDQYVTLRMLSYFEINLQ